MTDTELQQLKALADAATPGPWLHIDNDFYWDKVIANLEDRTVLVCVVDEGDERMEDFNFIADARTAIPALLAEVERLRVMWQVEHTERVRLEEALKLAQKISDNYRDDYVLGD